MSKPRKLYITLAELKAAYPCREGYKKLMDGIEFDKSCAPEDIIIPLELILAVNGPDDADWAYHNVYMHTVVRPSMTPAQYDAAWNEFSAEMDALRDKYPVDTGDWDTPREEEQNRRLMREFLKGKKRA